MADFPDYEDDTKFPRYKVGDRVQVRSNKYEDKFVLKHKGKICTIREVVNYEGIEQKQSIYIYGDPTSWADWWWEPYFQEITKDDLIQGYEI